MIKVTLQKEDMQVLASTLQEQLLMEMPSGQVFQVKCALKNDELMVLTQHPPGVAVDTEKVFAVLEEALQWQSQYHEQRTQFYVRVSGEKLPYAKHSIIIQAKIIQDHPETISEEASNGLYQSTAKNQLIFPPLNISELPSPVDDNISDNPFSSLTDDNITDTKFSSLTDDNISDNPFSLLTDDNISDTKFSSLTDDNITDTKFSSLTDDSISNTTFGSDASFSSDTTFSSDTSFSSDTTFSSDTSFLNESDNNAAYEEKFDPFTDEKNFSKRKKKVSLPSLPILLGGTLGVVVIFGGGAFFLTRACVIGECKELQTAEQFKSQSQQLIRQAKSEKELVAVQQQIDTVISDLKVIPQWSPRYQSAQEITANFSDQSAKINQVVKALESASAAEQKTKTPATSLEELRARQTLWRQVIIPLESIKPGNELYGLVRVNLPKYQSNLQTLNQQLLNEESWLKKLTTAKTVANSALKREAAAKSANDWQRVQFAWQEVVNDLKSIPATSTGHEEAKNLLADYQPKLILARNRAKRENTAALNFKRAVDMASKAKAYEAQNQWQAAIASWEQAEQTAKQVSQDSSFYNQAQSLIQSYSTAAAQAKEKQQVYGNLAQTRADLGKTCVNGTRFCIFNIEPNKIVVRLTPEYDQALQTANPDIQSHLQTLQQALGVIGENANLPIFLYNSQGQERYMKMPQ
ncbi:hypothetical protein A0J48_012230 [Sphaerospermopsis aphanizomenoides BCCUSP55]|uniref:hypothetical protein n=1 Tax=Sphaerospermopsis aphanizomenoides TaxID=459663 RepID=UPI001902D511|nr:hypothetical protein [Sphaerospermopsis aphanizomenoides]MBK1988296.1 hypothetical protein [Sphaerospermopsis aphanizomenoides BCCUSP55]